MSNQGTIVLLEDWLQTVSGAGGKIASAPSSSSAGQAIIQAWSDLRDLIKSESFDSRCLQALKTLCDCQNFLYISDSQARVLLSIISLPKASIFQEADPLLLRLLYVWLRKSSRQSSPAVDSGVQTLLHHLDVKSAARKNSFFLSEAILLLGAISFVPSVSEKYKTASLESLYRNLEEEYQLIGLSDKLMSHILAGIGYALCSTVSMYFVRILSSTFGLWEKIDCPSYSIYHGIMILHMIEWVVSNLLNSKRMDKVHLLQKEMSGNTRPGYNLFPLVMAAAGLLRVINRFGSNDLMHLRSSTEAVIETSASHLLSRTWAIKYSAIELRDRTLLQCISLAVARSGTVSFHAPLLLCLALALLQEIFPLLMMYGKILEFPTTNSVGPGLDEVKEHLDSIIYREAGVITGAFINQYVSANEESKNTVESLIWRYCQDIYSQHQQVALVLRGVNSSLLGELEKIAESAFLMVVVFALSVTKQRLGSSINPEVRKEISVKILISFSCMEYFRRMRLSEYMETIRAVVRTVQGTESACTLFVESLPSYENLTNRFGFSSGQNLQYNWFADEVQTARVLFYLRVIPTCIELLSTAVFEKRVAPTIFLYMGHPNGKVARASHTLFVSFLSSGKNPSEGETAALKEKLVFYYMQRSLEGYPEITPFEGMASGVAAIVRHLPAGSPAILYCIHCLIEKANSLCSTSKYAETDLTSTLEGDLEARHKILELLIRLLSLVDIQVLPVLMKLLAQLIVQLPKSRQTPVLNELYQQVAESDDVIRKPTFVSWLQSLSYLCSQDTDKSVADGKSLVANAASRIWNLSNLIGFSSRI